MLRVGGRGILYLGGRKVWDVQHIVFRGGWEGEGECSRRKVEV